MCIYIYISFTVTLCVGGIPGMSTFSILNDNSSFSKISCHSVMLQESSLYTATWLDPKVSFVPFWHGLCFAWVWSAGTHYASNWRTIQHGNHVLMSLMAVIVRAIILMNPEFLSCCLWSLIFDTFDRMSTSFLCFLVSKTLSQGTIRYTLCAYMAN